MQPLPLSAAEPAQGQAVPYHGSFHQGVGVERADPQGQSAQQAAAQEDPEGRATQDDEKDWDVAGTGEGGNG